MEKNELEELENRKRVGKALSIIGLSIFIIGLIIIIAGFIGYNKDIYNYVHYNKINTNNNSIFITGCIIHAFGLIIGIAGLVLYIINNKKITDYTKETIIPKAKETFNKVEPVVTDTAKAVGNDLKKAYNDIKKSFKKEE